MSTDYKMALWGQIFAELSKPLGGLTPAEIEIITAAPGIAFARTNLRAMRVMTDEDVDTVGALAADISPDDTRIKAVPIEYHGDFWLAFTRHGGRVARGGEKKPSGRKTMEASIEWGDVDWSLPNAQIARDKGCSRQNVAFHRGKHAENIN